MQITKKQLKELIKKSINEFNTISSGNVSGYTLPLGASNSQNIDQFKKGFFPDKNKGQAKTVSPELHKKK